MESSGTGAHLSIARLHKSNYRGGYTYHIHIKTNNKRKQTAGQAYFQDIVIMIVIFYCCFFRQQDNYIIIASMNCLHVGLSSGAVSVSLYISSVLRKSSALGSDVLNQS